MLRSFANTDGEPNHLAPLGGGFASPSVLRLARTLLFMRGG